MTLLEQYRAKLAEQTARMEALITNAETEARDLSSDEWTEFNEKRSNSAQLKEQIASLEEAEAARAAAAEVQRTHGTGIRVGNEPSIYRKDLREYGFLGDVVRAAAGHRDASERLARYDKEVRSRFSDTELRAINTTVGSGGAYVPPAYLEEEAIEYRRFARVLADLMTSRPLPEGTMTINIPKMTGGTAVAAQSAQNAAATETDFTDEFISQNVSTLAGQQTVSIQFIERSPIPVEDMVFADLKNACDQQVDATVIAALAGAGTAVAYTSTTPSPAALIPIIGQAKADVANGTAKKPANALVMTPSRWEWIATTGVDSAGRPLVPPTANLYNAFGEYQNIGGEKPVAVGTLAGLPVFTDGNIPSNLGAGTNQDEIFVIHRQSHWLMEGPVVVRALPQTLGNQLSILLQVYRYVAFFGNRYPDATSVVGGTGLVTPSF